MILIAPKMYIIFSLMALTMYGRTSVSVLARHQFSVWKTSRHPGCGIALTHCQCSSQRLQSCFPWHEPAEGRSPLGIATVR